MIYLTQHISKTEYVNDYNNFGVGVFSDVSWLDLSTARHVYKSTHCLLLSSQSEFSINSSQILNRLCIFSVC